MKKSALVLALVLMMTMSTFVGCGENSKDSNSMVENGTITEEPTDNIVDEKEKGVDDLGNDIKDGAEDLVDDTEDVLDGNDTDKNHDDAESDNGNKATDNKN